MAFTPLTSGDPPDVETTVQVSRPVRVSPMVDVEDDHGAAPLVDAVTDALTQLPRFVSLIDKSRATSASVLPVARTCSTARASGT